MKFLDTKDKLNILETEEHQTVNITLETSLFDLPAEEFKNVFAGYCTTITDYHCEVPLLISITCNDMPDDEIVDFGDLLFECLMQNFTTKEHKFEKDLWQPKTIISDLLNMTMDAQCQILNYKSLVPIFTVEFKNDKNQVLYNMIIDKGE